MSDRLPHAAEVELFLTLVDTPECERASLLASSCGEDTSLNQRMRRLLDAIDTDFEGAGLRPHRHCHWCHHALDAQP